MSEQNAELTSGESGSLGAVQAVPPSSEASIQPVVAAPDLEPGQGAEADAPKADTAAEATKPGAAKAEAPKVETPKAETPKAEAARFPGKVMIMSAGERKWDDDSAAPETTSGPSQEPSGKRRLAVAAMVALAVVAGAIGGALATAGLSHFVGGEVASADSQAIEASIARIDADIQALKAGVEHSSRLAVSQYSKTSERLDKVEKAQAEPAAKLAKLSETVDKLRATPPAAPPTPVAAAPAAAKEITGSIAPPATAAPVPLPAPKPEVARLPTVEGWVLRDVANGGALIEGRRGIFEVYAGDPVPGLGRIDAIRRQDGRWVVVTSKGLIVAR
ncbi:MAG: hypothetical protein ACXU9D_18370 [Xanthobacteraceae bacterium]